ncbi:hypothetical protein [Sulfurimonas sp.]
MKVSAHAAQRFLERVMNKSTYTCLDVDFSIRYLEKLLQDIIPTSYAKTFVIPGFENYRVIYRNNTVVTIIQKGKNHA